MMHSLRICVLFGIVFVSLTKCDQNNNLDGRRTNALRIQKRDATDLSESVVKLINLNIGGKKELGNENSRKRGSKAAKTMKTMKQVFEGKDDEGNKSETTWTEGGSYEPDTEWNKDRNDKRPGYTFWRRSGSSRRSGIRASGSRYTRNQRYTQKMNGGIESTKIYRYHYKSKDGKMKYRTVNGGYRVKKRYFGYWYKDDSGTLVYRRRSVDEDAVPSAKQQFFRVVYKTPSGQYYYVVRKGFGKLGKSSTGLIKPTDYYQRFRNCDEEHIYRHWNKPRQTKNGELEDVPVGTDLNAEKFREKFPSVDDSDWVYWSRNITRFHPTTGVDGEVFVTKDDYVILLEGDGGIESTFHGLPPLKTHPKPIYTAKGENGEEVDKAEVIDISSPEKPEDIEGSEIVGIEEIVDDQDAKPIKPDIDTDTTSTTKTTKTTTANVGETSTDEGCDSPDIDDEGEYDDLEETKTSTMTIDEKKPSKKTTKKTTTTTSDHENKPKSPETTDKPKIIKKKTTTETTEGGDNPDAKVVKTTKVVTETKTGDTDKPGKVIKTKITTIEEIGLQTDDEYSKKSKIIDMDEKPTEKPEHPTSPDQTKENLSDSKVDETKKHPRGPQIEGKMHPKGPDETKKQPKGPDGDEDKLQPKSPDDDETKKQPKSPDDDETKKQPKSPDDNETKKQPKSPDDDETKQPKSPDDDETKKQPKSPDDDETKKQPKSPDDYETKKKPKSPDDDETKKQPKSPDDDETKKQPKSPDDDETKKQPKSPDDNETKKQPKSPDDDETKRQPKSPDDYETKKKPKSPDDDETKKQPKSPDDYETKKQPKSPDDDETKKQPKSPDYVETKKQPKSPDDVETKKQPKSPDEVETKKQPKSPDDETKKQPKGPDRGDTTKQPKGTEDGETKKQPKVPGDDKTKKQPKDTDDGTTEEPSKRSKGRKKHPKRLKGETTTESTKTGEVPKEHPKGPDEGTTITKTETITDEIKKQPNGPDHETRKQPKSPDDDETKKQPKGHTDQTTPKGPEDDGTTEKPSSRTKGRKKTPKISKDVPTTEPTRNGEIAKYPESPDKVTAITKTETTTDETKKHMAAGDKPKDVTKPDEKVTNTIITNYTGPGEPKNETTVTNHTIVEEDGTETVVTTVLKTIVLNEAENEETIETKETAELKDPEPGTPDEYIEQKTVQYEKYGKPKEYPDFETAKKSKHTVVIINKKVYYLIPKTLKYREIGDVKPDDAQRDRPGKDDVKPVEKSPDEESPDSKLKDPEPGSPDEYTEQKTVQYEKYGKPKEYPDFETAKKSKHTVVIINKKVYYLIPKTLKYREIGDVKPDDAQRDRPGKDDVKPVEKSPDEESPDSKMKDPEPGIPDEYTEQKTVQYEKYGKPKEYPDFETAKKSKHTVVIINKKVYYLIPKTQKYREIGNVKPDDAQRDRAGKDDVRPVEKSPDDESPDSKLKDPEPGSPDEYTEQKMVQYEKYGKPKEYPDLETAKKSKHTVVIINKKVYYLIPKTQKYREIGDVKPGDAQKDRPGKDDVKPVEKSPDEDEESPDSKLKDLEPGTQDEYTEQRTIQYEKFGKPKEYADFEAAKKSMHRIIIIGNVVYYWSPKTKKFREIESVKPEDAKMYQPAVPDDMKPDEKIIDSKLKDPEPGTQDKYSEEKAVQYEKYGKPKEFPDFETAKKSKHRIVIIKNVVYYWNSKTNKFMEIQSVKPEDAKKDQPGLDDVKPDKKTPVSDLKDSEPGTPDEYSEEKIVQYNKYGRPKEFPDFETAKKSKHRVIIIKNVVYYLSPKTNKFREIQNVKPEDAQRDQPRSDDVKPDDSTKKGDKDEYYAQKKVQYKEYGKPKEYPNMKAAKKTNHRVVIIKQKVYYRTSKSEPFKEAPEGPSEAKTETSGDVGPKESIDDDIDKSEGTDEEYRLQKKTQYKNYGEPHEYPEFKTARESKHRVVIVNNVVYYRKPKSDKFTKSNESPDEAKTEEPEAGNEVEYRKEKLIQYVKYGKPHEYQNFESAKKSNHRVVIVKTTVYYRSQKDDKFKRSTESMTEARTEDIEAGNETEYIKEKIAQWETYGQPPQEYPDNESAIKSNHRIVIINRKVYYRCETKLKKINESPEEAMIEKDEVIEGGDGSEYGEQKYKQFKEYGQPKQYSDFKSARESNHQVVIVNKKVYYRSNKDKGFRRSMETEEDAKQDIFQISRYRDSSTDKRTKTSENWFNAFYKGITNVVAFLVGGKSSETGKEENEMSMDGRKIEREKEKEKTPAFVKGFKNRRKDSDGFWSEGDALSTKKNRSKTSTE